MMTQSVALQEDPEGDILTVSPSPDVSYPFFVSLWVCVHYRPTCDIYRHAESSVLLFASLANLSGPIPTSRGKKTFDKRPDILAVGPSSFARGFLNLAESDPCERDEWTLEKVRHRRR
ncbi:hypothetical protein ALC56_09693 [Trachymyrmex septentrionalis]|uniref:Uncharacterized protein n=1 Tax=Trachymyrmex septentrionalis TaxID=34720 RepID=A0A195F6T3_9HYME|nr:hypothetical protein ALC56_09693 [Trachymyrmex septentrionalis]